MCACRRAAQPSAMCPAIFPLCLCRISPNTCHSSSYDAYSCNGGISSVMSNVAAHGARAPTLRLVPVRLAAAPARACSALRTYRTTPGQDSLNYLKIIVASFCTPFLTAGDRQPCHFARPPASPGGRSANLLNAEHPRRWVLHTACALLKMQICQSTAACAV